MPEAIELLNWWRSKNLDKFIALTESESVLTPMLWPVYPDAFHDEDWVQCGFVKVPRVVLEREGW